MNISDKGDYLSSLEQDRHMEFSRSIIEGVEIKRCRNNPHAYKSHVHNELSLGYIIEGTTDLTLRDRTIHYGSGDGVIIPSLMTHRCAPKDINHWAYVMLFVNSSYYSELVSFSQAKKLTGDQVRKLIGFIEQLLIETIPDTLENILIELLLEFGDKDISEITPTDTSDRVKTIHDYILAHVNEVITLDELQQISGLNKFSLIRNFKKLYVTTPAAYHLQCRVAEAKKLLSKGVDVFDICEELRFYDQAHLIREFKKMYGITPATYTHQVKG
ncbi:AraC family transcriptional regulator [Desulfosporosinus shakirovi]|uniref:AraC family transcriptional regulator n=1 Tax=Desulfosporosinus shakirovi TaxID=2885154 RepID=UPI001E40D0A1|nr:AraC family transcriptional regulator [Desulfosporosinus sp. SRJS8]MCB8818242.1 AraC family transcriptional regulator [Desulfosporosinus sp. SRJS8]